MQTKPKPETEEAPAMQQPPASVIPVPLGGMVGGRNGIQLFSMMVMGIFI